MARFLIPLSRSDFDSTKTTKAEDLMTNRTSIHGHEVLRLIAAARPPLTRDDLRRQVAERFGSDARFHTCSGENLTLDELLEFLHHRGKVVEQGGFLRTDIGLMCDHSD